MKIIALVALCLLIVSGSRTLRNKIKGEDMREDVELFMQNFFLEAFGLQLPLVACDHDAQKVEDLIISAMDQIKDQVDFIGLVKAAQVIANNRDTLYTAFADCEQTLIVFKDAALVCYPLTDLEVAVSAATQAALHHPLTFTLNINRAKDALARGDWASAGKYAGKNVHYILDELDEED